MTKLKDIQTTILYESTGHEIYLGRSFIMVCTSPLPRHSLCNNTSNGPSTNFETKSLQEDN